MSFTIFISIFFLVGFGVLGYGAHSFYRGRQALSWPAVEGRLVECSFQEHSDSESTTWEVKVRYSLFFTTGFTVLWTMSSRRDTRILEQIQVVE